MGDYNPPPSMSGLFADLAARVANLERIVGRIGRVWYMDAGVMTPDFPGASATSNTTVVSHSLMDIDGNALTPEHVLLTPNSQVLDCASFTYTSTTFSVKFYRSDEVAPPAGGFGSCHWFAFKRRV